MMSADNVADKDEPVLATELTTAEMIVAVVKAWKNLLGLGAVLGAIGLGVALLIPPTFIAQTVIVPPQQQQSASVAAALGPLAGLMGGGAIKSPADQYVSIMTSVTVFDRIIDRFDLMKVYDERYRSDARKQLGENVAVVVGKKDGLLVISVEDRDPRRAADMANALVGELRVMTHHLALSEAQQRRQFFEKKLTEVRDGLEKSQQAVQDSRFDASVLRVDPRASADSYARLRAELTAADVRLQMLRRTLADGVPEVQQQAAVVVALRRELKQLEQSGQAARQADYVGKYRDFKYHEALFELYAKQYEMARADESREGALIQVIDPAQPPDRKSKPRKAYFLMGGFALGVLLAGLHAYVRAGCRRFER